MNTTSERCNGCNGHGEVPNGYTRFHSGLMAWRVCDECHGVGTVEIEAEPAPITVAANYAPLITAVKAGDVMEAYRVVDMLIPSRGCYPCDYSSRKLIEYS